MGSPGGPKLVPRKLAQHHCSPPPEAALMAGWLNALRKRHAKQYKVMQTELKEIEYFKERKEGYKESVKADIKRKEEERVEEEKRLAAEKEEQEKEGSHPKAQGGTQRIIAGRGDCCNGQDNCTPFLRMADPVNENSPLIRR